MLSVADALTIIQQQLAPLPPAAVPLDAALGLVLAEDVLSDLDMPPYTKALMDGFALRSEDGAAERTIVDTVMAGQTPHVPVGNGQATRIMTGAPLPPGADAVVMIERCQVDGTRLRIDEPRLAAGQNVLPRGHEMRMGDTVLRVGTRIRPQEIGLLAAVGHVTPKVRPRPAVAVLATGDELVDPAERPGSGQIRNSNAAMLCAQVQRPGGRPQHLGIARDNDEHLLTQISRGLKTADVLILSGGVSAGQRDLVPGVLEAMGVQALFHKVSMKPGKPVLFGVQPRDGDGPPRLVFGLPGNPVSSLVCFELFVRPALRTLMGLEPGPRIVSATLTADYPYRTDRPTYHPARLRMTDTGWRVEIVPWFGSADLRGVGPANAFAVLPAGEHTHRAGQALPVLCVEIDD